MEIESLYRLFLAHPKVTTDSRKIEPGSMFFALKGEHFNGNGFAMAAIEQGAAYAIVDEPVYAIDERILLVQDVLQTLQDLARYHRQKMAIPVLAITGTNGKTTTKELVSLVLTKKYNLVNTQGNLNNHIGVPLTLLTITNRTEFAVVEMGANHPGEIEALCRIALPNFGLITNVGRAHLEGFGSFEGVIRTKTELYRFLQGNKGMAFINRANPYLTENAGEVERVNYTTARGLDGLEGEVAGVDPFLTLKILFPKGWLYIKTKLVGAYNLENVLAAATVGYFFEIEPTIIADAIESYRPDNNRSQLVQTERNRLLMDAYNANPTSTRAALDNFKMMDAQKKGVILGDMLELGEASGSEHQKIVDLLASMPLDFVALVGTNYAACNKPDHFLQMDSAGAISSHLRTLHLSGYLLLIKGSRGMKLETILPEL